MLWKLTTFSFIIWLQLDTFCTPACSPWKKLVTCWELSIAILPNITFFRNGHFNWLLKFLVNFYNFSILGTFWLFTLLKLLRGTIGVSCKSKRTSYLYVLMKNISLILLPFVTVSIECFIKYISWPNSKTSELWLLSQQRAKFINTKFWTSIQASGRIAYSVDHDNSSVGQWLCTLYIVESSMATSVNRSLLLLSVQCIRDCRFIVLSLLQLTSFCYNIKGLWLKRIYQIVEIL